MATILVVEDEPIVGLQLQESLVAMGHSVPPVVESGDAVMTATMVHRPDLILMDIQLRSFVDGIDAARRVKFLCGTPVIFLTAFPSEGSEERASLVSPAAYLVKPVDEPTLAVHVARALGTGRGPALDFPI